MFNKSVKVVNMKFLNSTVRFASLTDALLAAPRMDAAEGPVDPFRGANAPEVPLVLSAACVRAVKSSQSSRGICDGDPQVRKLEDHAGLLLAGQGADVGDLVACLGCVEGVNIQIPQRTFRDAADVAWRKPL